MEGSENVHADRTGLSRSMSTRSASPAKRNAAEMEGGPQDAEGTNGSQPPSIVQDGGPTDFDTILSGIQAQEAARIGSAETQDTAMDTQPTATNSLAASTLGEISTSTSATSFQSSESGQQPAHKEPYTTEEIDQQVAHVQQLMKNAKHDEGVRCYLISNKWLSRVLSRSSEGLNNAAHPKAAREGPVGPVDSSDIITDDAHKRPILCYSDGHAFVPLKPGMTLGQDFEALPADAYGYVVGLYGYTEKIPIVRYMHNTASEGQEHYVYEFYPPVITIQKVPQPHSAEQPQAQTKNALNQLMLTKEREKMGQISADDALRLVSSQSERFQRFLTRAKEAAGIPRATKVKLWRVQKSSNVQVDGSNDTQSGVTPLSVSQETSPTQDKRAIGEKLVVELAVFQKLDLDKDVELIDARDETGNSNYNGKSTMSIHGFHQDQTLLLEEQIGGPGGGEYPSDTKKPMTVLKSFLPGKKGAGITSKPGSAPASGRTSPAPGMMTRGRTRRDGRTRGTVGLGNLGNTCYMNSALQCIRSVEELAVYFNSGHFQGEINTVNPLGHNGNVARAYASVLNGIYGDSASTSFSPSNFKRVLGNAATIFSGYAQQDSQEFLSFLVDALHEDLNRILKKPYFENPDSDDKTVHDPQAIIELGEVYRSNYKARNDSIATDLFNGFYKNTMECPDCSKVSVTFDPYSLVTLQLPVENTFQHEVLFLPWKGEPVVHGLDLDKNATIRTVKDFIAGKHPGVDASRLWMVEVYNQKVYKVFSDFATIAESNIASNDHIFVYELDATPHNIATAKKPSYNILSMHQSSKADDSMPEEGMDAKQADCFAVPIFNRTRTSQMASSKLAMHPLYVSITREEAKDFNAIAKKILVAVSSITSRPFLEEWYEQNPPHTSGAHTRNADDSKDSTTLDDTAGVSDYSAPSEDGYVNVSLAKPSQPIDTSRMNVDNPREAILQRFLDPDFPLDPRLLQYYFDIKYVKGPDSSMHIAGFNGFSDSAARPMFDRVKVLSRRQSLSTESGESTSTSHGSPEQDDAEDAESNADDTEKPDIVIGGESQLSSSHVEDSDESLPADPVHYHSNVKGARKKNRKNGKKGKKNRRRNERTYGKNAHRAGQARGYGSTPSSTQSTSEDSPYYIQLGEGIVLDWTFDGAAELFSGQEDGDEGLGERLTDDTGSSRATVVFQDSELEEKKRRRAHRDQHGITLEDCFQETGKREILSEDNSWYCNQCKEMRRAAKTLQLWTLPDILVVHLKRFGGNRSFRDKIDVTVNYPIEGLDLTEKVGMHEDGKEYIYDLFAVDNHFGGLGGGHYTAQAKNFYDGLWYNYNDSQCLLIGEEPKQSSSAYLLFYRRRSDKPLGPPALQELVYRSRHPEAEEVDESEPGEGRLGGPTPRSLHGSSSASVAAGVGVTNSLKGQSGNGGPIGVDSSPITNKMTMTDDGDHEMAGLQVYGNQGDEWGFDDAGDESTTQLLENVDDDADSTTANKADDDSGFESDYRNDSPSPVLWTGIMEYAHGDSSDGPAEFEDVGDASNDLDDPPAADIHLSPSHDGD